MIYIIGFIIGILLGLLSLLYKNRKFKKLDESTTKLINIIDKFTDNDYDFLVSMIETNDHINNRINEIENEYELFLKDIKKKDYLIRNNKLISIKEDEEFILPKKLKQFAY